jgi:UDP-3-O-[3-hydroxymyristoyl] glucosamine N-acyltransferase
VKSSSFGANRSNQIIEGGKTYFGNTYRRIKRKLKQLANIKKIPEILSKLK